MNILDKIVANKKKEIELKKKVITISDLERTALFQRKNHSLAKCLQNSSSGIIAEHKRRSPSKSEINQNLNIQEVAIGYEKARVCGMSVLTDGKYFGGSIDDLILARAACNLPILRKDFMIDEFQILEAKAYGADVILLIAAVLSPAEIQKLSKLASSLDLEVLLEVHNLEELERSLFPEINMVGVNNRNLKTFEVSTEISKNLSEKIPSEFIKVSESGISSEDVIQDLKDYGYRGFLIGENFMKTDNPGKSAESFIANLEKR